MALSFSNLCVQVTLPSPLPGRLAQHQRHRLCDPQLYGRTVAAIPGQGVYHLPARPLRGGGIITRDQGRQAASPGRILIIGWWLRGDTAPASIAGVRSP
jgi:hypothetical protein